MLSVISLSCVARVVAVGVLYGVVVGSAVALLCCCCREAGRDSKQAQGKLSIHTTALHHALTALLLLGPVLNGRFLAVTITVIFQFMAAG